MHSLRHYVNNQLIHIAEVHAVTRLDLLGHIDKGEDANINTAVYRDESPMEIKRRAVECLARLF